MIYTPPLRRVTYRLRARAAVAASLPLNTVILELQCRLDLGMSCAHFLIMTFVNCFQYRSSISTDEST